MKISAVIITYNEAHNIERCLTSIAGVVDETIVVDSFSADATCAIASKMGATVIQHPFKGHIQQKNYAKDQASFPWVLSLDADEALSDTLRDSLLELKKNHNSKFSGYSMNRLNRYCGQWIRHGNWYPDKKLRLWLRDQGSWQGTNPHDKFELENGEIGHLKGDLLHYSIANRAEHLAVIRKYASISANALKEKGKGHQSWKRFTSPIASFLRGYILRLGFLDGAAGFQIGYLSAYAKYLKYKKLGK